MHICHESNKTVTGPISARIVALYHQNRHFNDKLMYYDGDKAIANVLHTSDLNSKVVYCDSKLFIEEVVNNSKKVILLYELSVDNVENPN